MHVDTHKGKTTTNEVAGSTIHDSHSRIILLFCRAFQRNRLITKSPEHIHTLRVRVVRVAPRIYYTH